VANLRSRFDEAILQSLMIAFSMKMINEFGGRLPQRRLTKENQLVQAFFA
jgi:hypothetical protein